MINISHEKALNQICVCVCVCVCVCSLANKGALSYSVGIGVSFTPGSRLSVRDRWFVTSDPQFHPSKTS